MGPNYASRRRVMMGRLYSNPLFSERKMKRLLGVLITALGIAVPQAQAGMIATDEAVQSPSERERVKAALERPEVVQQMQKMGLDAKDAAARVDAMSDSEVTALVGKIDALPAGGVLTNDQLIVILLLVIILVLLL